MTYVYKYGDEVCSTPHGTLYWLFTSGEDYHGITESGHYYRRNTTYGYYFINKLEIIFNADKLKKYQWRALNQAVINNQPKIFYEAKPIGRSKTFGSIETKEISGLKIDFCKFMDFTLTEEVFEAFKLLSKSNSGKMTQKYKWTGRTKAKTTCQLEYDCIYGINLEEDLFEKFKLNFFIGDTTNYVTTMSLVCQDKVYFEFMFNSAKLDKLTYEEFYAILEKEISI